jgi:hypothetical protein
MGLFSSSKKEKLVIVFDIASGSVGGAIVRIPLDNKSLPTIIKSTRTDIKSHTDFNFNIFLKDMIVALDLTATFLYSQKVGAPDEIVCVLASPWYLSETRTIKMSREKPFIFTKKLADELIQKEILSINKLYKDKYNDFKSIPKIIEQYTMEVILDGSTIDEPIGKKCQFFEMNMVISLTPQLCLDKINETLSTIFHHIPVSFSSFTIDTYFAVRNKYMNLDSYMLIDISGEITDIGIVTKGILKSLLSFPFGKTTFLQYICKKLNIELRDAKELFNLYSKDNLSLELKEKVTPIFASIENSWGENFNKCINTLLEPLTLPSTVFLTADNDIQKWFTEALCNNKNLKLKSSNNKFNIVTLDGPIFLSMCDIREGLCDPFLMIESIAIMRKTLK